jgi:DHA1 family multidrug resistance protein-like MFS transporter
MSDDAAALRNQRVLAAVVFVVYTAFAFIIPFLPLYVRDLGVKSEGAVALWGGVLIGVSPLLAGMLAPLWGRLADRYGHKKMFARALVSYVVLLGLSAIVTDVRQLLLLRIGIGVFGGVGPLGLSMASASAREGDTGRAIGRVQASQNLSAAVGPFVGGFLAATVGIRTTFVITAIACLMALALLVFGYHEARKPAPAERPRASMLEMIRSSPLALLLVILFFVNFIGRSFTPVLPLYVERLGVSSARAALATGVLISFYSIAAAASSTLLGRAAARRDAQRLLGGSLLGGALLVTPMAFAPSYPALLALSVLLGLSFGGALTLCYTLGGRAISTELRGTAFGFLASAALFGGAIAPSIAGLLAKWDLRAIYYVDAVLFVILAAVVFTAPRRSPAAAESTDDRPSPATAR